MEDVRVPSDQRAHESILPWQKGWQTLKAIWPQLVYISLLTVSIPQCLLAFIQAKKALTAGAQFDFNPALSLKDSLATLQAFAVSYIAYALLAFVAAFLGYLTVIAIVLQRKRSLPPNLGRAFLDALQALPKAMLLAGAAVGGFLLFLQVLLRVPGAGFFLQILLMIGSVLMAGIPVLLMVEPKSLGKVMNASLRMSYVEGSGFSRWSAFFVLLSFEILLMGLLAVVDLLYQKLKVLDLNGNLPLTLWTTGSETFPFGYATAAFDLLRFSLDGLATMAFACFSAAFVLELSYRSRVGERIEVRA